MNIQLRVAEKQDLDQILGYVHTYHQFEGIDDPEEELTFAIRSLLGESSLGRIWLIRLGNQSIGYVALCFGYSIEFMGRDAFIDEIFIVSEYRGKGYGKAALILLKSEAARLGVRALHLEVAHTNHRAQHLYRAIGFTPREKYFLMSATIGKRTITTSTEIEPGNNR